MSTTLDTGVMSVVSKLTDTVHSLDVSVAQLRTIMEQWGPVLQSQVTGLTSVENRVTRQEDALTMLIARLEREKADAEKLAETQRKEQEARLNQVRFTFTIVCSIMGLSITLISFLMLHFRPR